MASSVALNFSSTGEVTSASLTVNPGEQARIRLSQVSAYPSLSLAITRNGATNRIPLTIAQGASIALPWCKGGDSIAIVYDGQTANDALTGILESLPESPADNPATSTPISGGVSTTAVTPVSPPSGGFSGTAPAFVIGPFSPQLNRPIWATLIGSGASGTAQILRSTDGGATKNGLTVASNPWDSWSFSGVTGSVLNETVGTESDASATWWLAVTLTAGSLTYRVAQ